MEKLIILLGLIVFLLILVALLGWMIKIISQERDANEKEIWRLTKENSNLIAELSKALKLNPNGRN